MRKLSTDKSVQKEAQRHLLRPFDRSLPSQKRNQHRDELMQRLQKLTYDLKSAQGYIDALKKWFTERDSPTAVWGLESLERILARFWESTKFNPDDRWGGFGNTPEGGRWSLQDMLAKKTRWRGSDVNYDMNRFLDDIRGTRRDFDEYDGMGLQAEEEKAFESIDKAMDNSLRFIKDQERYDVQFKELANISERYMTPLRQLFHQIRNVDYIPPYDTEYYRQ
jgi:hypothetical protein